MLDPESTLIIVVQHQADLRTVGQRLVPRPDQTPLRSQLGHLFVRLGRWLQGHHADTVPASPHAARQPGPFAEHNAVLGKMPRRSAAQ